MNLAILILLIAGCSPKMTALTDASEDASGAFAETQRTLDRLDQNLAHQTASLAVEINKTRESIDAVRSSQPDLVPAVAPPAPIRSTPPLSISPAFVTLDPDDRTALLTKVGEHTATARDALRRGIELQERLLNMSQQIDALMSATQSTASTAERYGPGGIFGIIMAIIGYLGGKFQRKES